MACKYSLSEWLSEALTLMTVKPKALAGYESLTKFLLAGLGYMPIDSISTLDVQRFVSQSAVSASRTRQAYGLLSQVLNMAVSYEVLERPLGKVRLPRMPQRDVQCLGLADVEPQLVAIPFKVTGLGEGDLTVSITSVTVSNRPHAIVTRVRFVEATYGYFAVFYRARGHERLDRVRLGSDHRRRGDTNVLDTADGPMECPRVAVTWDHAHNTVVARLPSRCFLHGDYRRIGVQVLTEIVVDADYAPDGPTGRPLWTRWVGRD
jgi:hypothetical protein